MSNRKLKPYADLARKQQLRRLEAQRIMDLSSFSPAFMAQELQELIILEPEINCLNKNGENQIKEKKIQNNCIIGEDVNLNLNCEDHNMEELTMAMDEAEFWDKMNYYSDDEDEEDIGSKELTLWEKLADWALRNAKNRFSVNEILQIFRELGHIELPKDARTLLGTPRKSSNIVDCGSGKYLHYGSERSLCDLLLKIGQDSVPNHILFDINIDGLPLSKSSRSQLFPILGKISGSSYPEVFLIGAYHGYEKVESIEEFLNSFIEEYLMLKETGFTYNGIKYTLEINLIICDSPARSLVTGTKSHNGYFGCPRCIDEEDYSDHRMCFLSTNSPLRTDQSFLIRENLEHHVNGISHWL